MYFEISNLVVVGVGRTADVIEAQTMETISIMLRTTTTRVIKVSTTAVINETLGLEGHLTKTRVMKLPATIVVELDIIKRNVFPDPTTIPAT